MKRVQSFLSLAVCVFLLGGCAKAVPQTISVGTTAIKTNMFSSGYATVGIVEPEALVNVIPKYSGTVQQTFKEVGEKVKAGDTLLQLDTTPIMNQIKTQEASLAQAKAGVSQANTGVEQANTGIKKATKGVDQANAGLESVKINSATTENGTNQQTLLQYQTASENATNTYNSAQLTQQQAQRDYDNTKTLYEAGVSSKFALNAAGATLDKANTAMASAQTTLDTAQKNLDLYANVLSRQSVASANANIKNAEVGVDSAESSVESARASLDTATAAVQSAKAAVNTSQTQLENLKSQVKEYTVTSPIDGVIISKNVVLGAMATQTPVYTVANIDQVTITMSVPKNEINKLTLGGKAEVFYADQSSVLTQITALSNSANAANLYMVQVTVENKDNAFKAGMDAKVVFIEKQDKSIVVPFDSVVSSGKDNYVFVDENNIAKKIPVKVLGKNADEIAIEPIEGSLSDDAQVVTHNANMLKDGDSIKKEN